MFAIGEAEERVSVGIVDASGGAITTLAEAEGASMYPSALAPDARSLLVLRSEPTPSGKTRDRLGLVALDADGPPRLFGPIGAVLRNPSWAPDGSFVVFESDADSFRDLYRLQPDADTPLRLTNDPQGNFEPEVSPDGQSIVFASSRDGNAEIYRMTADGGSPQRLTTSSGDDVEPHWSPDGQTIAFVSARDRGRGRDVFTMPASGGEARPLVAAREVPVMARDLAWSPDGTKLALTQVFEAGQVEVAIVDVAAGAVVATSPGETTEQQPSWSPDGAQIVFARGGAGETRLVRMAADGGGATAITEAGGVHWLPHWVADPGCPRVEAVLSPVSGSGQG